MSAVRASTLLVAGLLSALWSPAQAATPTPGCAPIAGLTDCKADDDCVVVDQTDCCPCSMGGQQAAINRDKQDELSVQVAVCCAAAGVCLDVYLCEDNLAARCQSGKCGLENVIATPTPTPIPTLNECNPSSPECPAGTECYCCCGAFRCLPPGVPCCAIACVFPTPSPAATATPTPPAGECVGDCNGDRTVNIDELILGVNIALGNADVSACISLQCDQSVEGVFVNCLLIAVSNALHGCPRPNQIPTATNTPRSTPVLPHGQTCCECENDACTDFSWVEVERVCPLGCRTFMDAECEAPCHGGPQRGPATCVPLTPCTSDSGCDDRNGCTIDHCTLNGCTHDCVCV